MQQSTVTTAIGRQIIWLLATYSCQLHDKESDCWQHIPVNCMTGNLITGNLLLSISWQVIWLLTTYYSWMHEWESDYWQPIPVNCMRGSLITGSLFLSIWLRATYSGECQLHDKETDYWQPSLITGSLFLSIWLGATYSGDCQLHDKETDYWKPIPVNGTTRNLITGNLFLLFVWDIYPLRDKTGTYFWHDFQFTLYTLRHVMMSGHVKYKRNSSACKIQEDSACFTENSACNAHLKIKKGTCPVLILATGRHTTESVGNLTQLVFCELPDITTHSFALGGIPKSRTFPLACFDWENSGNLLRCSGINRADIWNLVDQSKPNKRDGFWYPTQCLKWPTEHSHNITQLLATTLLNSLRSCKISGWKCLP